MIKETLSWTRVTIILAGWLLLTLMGMPFVLLGFLYEFFSGSFMIGKEAGEEILKAFVRLKLR